MNSINSFTIGDGPVPLVFLHGLFGQGRNWMGIAKAISDQATSLLIDAPNHGRSAWTENFSYSEFAHLIHDHVIAQPGFENRYALVGHSMGGKIAMRMALAHPDKVQALAVVDISPTARKFGDEFPNIIDALQSINLSELETRSEASDQIADLVPLPATRDFLLQNLHRVPGQEPPWAWRMNLDLLCSQLSNVSGWEPVEAQYPGPTLWLVGSGSNYVQDQDLPQIRNLFPRAVVTKVKGAGHWVHSDQPDSFLSSLRSFLSSTYPD